MSTVLPTWRLLFPDFACVRDLYRISREFGMSRWASFRMAYWGDRHARHSALAARLGIDGVHR